MTNLAVAAEVLHSPGNPEACRAIDEAFESERAQHCRSARARLLPSPDEAELNRRGRRRHCERFRSCRAEHKYHPRFPTLGPPFRSGSAVDVIQYDRNRLTEQRRGARRTGPLRLGA